MYTKAELVRGSVPDSSPDAHAENLTPEQVRLARDSWARVAPIAEQAAALFYDRLFQLDPSLKRLFKGDMRTQGAKLTRMIAVAVDNLERIDTIVPAVEDLGRRHVSYGVEDRHYDTVGAALLWTLEKGLGDDFTEEAKAAWTTVYGLLARTMKKAAAVVA